MFCKVREMDVSKYFIALFYFLNIVFLVKCNVPVLLWESSAISDKDDVIPALNQLDSDEFSNHIIKKVHVHKPLIVVFLEESLSIEDFSWKDDQSRGSFLQLQNITSMSAKTEFITSVDNPVSALKDLSDTQGYTWKKYDGSKLPNKAGEILEVRLEDPLSEEDRPELLRRHDGSIAITYSQLLAKHSNIVAILTGKYSSWVEPEYNRVRREAEEESTSTAGPEVPTIEALSANDKVRISFTEAPELTINNSEPIKLTSPMKIDLDEKKKSGEISLIPFYLANGKKISFRFRFLKHEGTWKLEDVTYSPGDPKQESVLTSNIDIIGQLNKSFASKKPIEFSGNGIKLRFSNFQAEPWTMSAAFNPPTEDYAFFTIPILMGIFVTVILGAILTWALIMMLDIRTMDRFDDPKGKTITVAQAD